MRRINFKPKKRREIIVQQAVDYRQGAEGMITWVEENCCVPIYPEGCDIAEWCQVGNLPREKNPITDKSYWDLWCEQKEILREALRMENGRFVYKLIVLCWMRGEGKSLLACLIQLWKFFCWPKQQITLGANSKEQTKFVHYDIIRDIILNSPKLFNIVGKRNIQEKEIRLKDKNNRVVSVIRSISSFSGIVSNITGYTFSEIFDMKNPKFFVQLDGSIRNIPNALGVIDSTVSDKRHILYQLFLNHRDKKTETVYFSHRSSRTGVQEDYWNPNMDNKQLNDYRIKFPFGEFEKYFLNVWSAGKVKIFDERMVDEARVIGACGEKLNHVKIKEILDSIEHKETVLEEVKKKGMMEDGVEETATEIVRLKSQLTPLDSVFRLTNQYGAGHMGSMEDLNRLGDLFDTDWSILVGLDMADPMAVRRKARSILGVLAKGYPGSRSTPFATMLKPDASPLYLYILLFIMNVEDHSLNTVKDALEECHSEYDGIDCVCSERYGAWDMEKWCEERDITFEAIFPNYDRQRAAFNEFYRVMNRGRLKVPYLNIPGSKSEDIFAEEATAFEHDPDKRWFGSLEKIEKHGIQDDVIYMMGWGIYGGRLLGVEDFRPRKKTVSFGMFEGERGLLGAY